MHQIHIAYAYGDANGFVGEPEQFPTYLSRHTLNAEYILANLRFHTIAILKSMSVDEDYQGKGLGKSLLTDFEERAEDFGAQAILLVADTSEIQRSNFDLVKFYKANGYKQIAKTSTGPLMMKTIS